MSHDLGTGTSSGIEKILHNNCRIFLFCSSVFFTILLFQMLSLFICWHETCSHRTGFVFPGAGPRLCIEGTTTVSGIDQAVPPAEVSVVVVTLLPLTDFFQYQQGGLHE